MKLCKMITIASIVYLVITAGIFLVIRKLLAEEDHEDYENYDEEDDHYEYEFKKATLAEDYEI